MKFEVLEDLKDGILIELENNPILNKSSLLRWVVTVFMFTLMFIFVILSGIIIIPLGILELIPTNLKFPSFRKINKIIKSHEEKVWKDANSSYYYLVNDNYEQIRNTSRELKYFILAFITYYNEEYLTRRDIDDVFICASKRRRSLGDTYLICKHYFPDCTIEEVLIALMQLTANAQIRGMYCTTIYKYVWTTTGRSRSTNWDDKVEYNDNLKMRDIANYYKIKINNQ